MKSIEYTHTHTHWAMPGGKAFVFFDDIPPEIVIMIFHAIKNFDSWLNFGVTCKRMYALQSQIPQALQPWRVGFQNLGYRTYPSVYYKASHGFYKESENQRGMIFMRTGPTYVKWMPRKFKKWDDVYSMAVFVDDRVRDAVEHLEEMYLKHRKERTRITHNNQFGEDELELHSTIKEYDNEHVVTLKIEENQRKLVDLINSIGEFQTFNLELMISFGWRYQKKVGLRMGVSRVLDAHDIRGSAIYFKGIARYKYSDEFARRRMKPVRVPAV